MVKNKESKKEINKSIESTIILFGWSLYLFGQILLGYITIMGTQVNNITGAAMTIGGIVGFVSISIASYSLLESYIKNKSGENNGTRK